MDSVVESSGMLARRFESPPGIRQWVAWMYHLRHLSIYHSLIYPTFVQISLSILCGPCLLSSPDRHWGIQAAGDSRGCTIFNCQDVRDCQKGRVRHPLISQLTEKKVCPKSGFNSDSEMLAIGMDVLLSRYLLNLILGFL